MFDRLTHENPRVWQGFLTVALFLKVEFKVGPLGYNFIYTALRLLTPPMETPDPPSDTPEASKQVVLAPHDIPRILRV